MSDPTTKKYIRNVRRELDTAKKKGFPIFVIYSPELNTAEHIELERHFAGCNVVKTINRHVDTSLYEEDIEKQIADLFEEAVVVNDYYEFQRDHSENDLFVIIATKEYLRELIH